MGGGWCGLVWVGAGWRAVAGRGEAYTDRSCQGAAKERVRVSKGIAVIEKANMTFFVGFMIIVTAVLLGKHTSLHEVFIAGGMAVGAVIMGLGWWARKKDDEAKGIKREYPTVRKRK